MKILTFDIEEWFHLLDRESSESISRWSSYEIRIHKNMERIFTVLELHNVSATFFCLGWVAKNYPEIIREIKSRGYEVGSHAMMHQAVYDQGPKTFKRDVEQSIKLLEDLTGEKIRYFRAPLFSINEKTKWAFEILKDLGIEVDCSIFPAPHTEGGYASYTDPVPSLIRHNGIELKELPINSKNILGKSIIYSGGGYFRLLPYPVIRRWSGNSDYVMTYFHPRDFDPDQPRIKALSAKKKFRSYFGLNGALNKLHKLLDDFEFVDCKTAIGKIDWDNVPKVNL
jgi:peptidoglycan-N-acetylglucosamine deacetylase